VSSGATGELHRQSVGPLRWYVEVLVAAVGYGVYAGIRNLQGREESVAAYRHALRNSLAIVHLEQRLGLYHERAFQRLLLHVPLLVKGLDSYWAIAHFTVTVAVIVWLIRRHPDRYRPLRTALAISTGIGLLVFAVFPAVPPRMLPASFGFVDTWVKVGGIAARTPPRIERISDPFAAMPSLHVAWAVWCTAAVYPVCRRRFSRMVAVAYPAVTVIAVVASANHFVLDCVAGAACTGVALLVVGRWGRRRSGDETSETDGADPPRLVLTG
jgi:hypothetical protein